MRQVLEELNIKLNFTDDLIADSLNLMSYCFDKEKPEHCRRVASHSEELAKQFNYDSKKAVTAAYLHDLSDVIPFEKMVDLCPKFNIDVLPEERDFPMLLHQKFSRIIAIELFNIEDTEILNAIECHTTLKENPETLDLILFIADKLSWSTAYNRQFIDSMYSGLKLSLHNAAFAYIEYLYNNRETLKVLHPWAEQAYNYLNNWCKNQDGK